MNNKFQLLGRIRSFKYAFNGIWTMLKSQHNAWIHACATFFAVFAGFIFSISSAEWCWLILAIVSVWSAEALNTALEFLADAASPDFNPLVKKAKDIAAGAVLITSIGALTIGLIVLGPYIFALVR